MLGAFQQPAVALFSVSTAFRMAQVPFELQHRRGAMTCREYVRLDRPLWFLLTIFF